MGPERVPGPGAGGRLSSCCLHLLLPSLLLPGPACAAPGQLREARTSSREARHILSHKHTLGGEAASVCLWFIFREWVVDNYPHNNETPLTIKLQIHTAPSWDGGICGAGLLLGWGTLLCVRCAKTNLDNSRLALSTHPTNTVQSEHPKTRPVRWGGVGPHSNPHQIKLSFKACWAPTMPKILEVCSVISNEWLCR